MYFIRKIISRFLLLLLPVDILSRVLFDLKIFFLGISKSKILILATITKTGTHYVRFLLAYYLKMLSLKKDGKNFDIAPDDFIVDDYFPNSWHTAYTFILKNKKPTKHLGLIGLHDIPRSHMKLRKLAWRNIKVLHTYRDLKDQAMVSWHMKYNCNKDLNKSLDSPNKVFNIAREDNYAQLESFKDLSTVNLNHLRINFDQIFHEPANSLALILQWLGEEPDMELCTKASELAQNTPSILVGGGEKWHRTKVDNVDYQKLNTFIQSYKDSGAIGIGKKL